MHSHDSLISRYTDSFLEEGKPPSPEGCCDKGWGGRKTSEAETVCDRLTAPPGAPATRGPDRTTNPICHGGTFMVASGVPAGGKNFDGTGQKKKWIQNFPGKKRVARK